MFRSRIPALLSTATQVTRVSRRTLAAQATAESSTSPPADPSTVSSTELADLPPNVLAAYLAPGRVPVQQNIPACHLHLRSYEKEAVLFFADFAMRAAYHLNLPARGPVPMPKRTERWTVIRGPFVHKKSQENFERMTYKRMIKIVDGHPDVVERWLGYLNANMMPGVGMKANTYSFESLGVGKRMQQARNEAAIRGKQAPRQAREIPNQAAEQAKKLLAKKEYRDPEHDEAGVAETVKVETQAQDETSASVDKSVENKETKDEAGEAKASPAADKTEEVKPAKSPRKTTKKKAKE